MSVLWTREAAVAATGGTSDRDWQATGVSIDTRSLLPGDLFVALTAARDGHDFVAEALARGAAAALVSRVPEGVAPDAPLLIVPDVLEGLRALGAAARARFRGRVVAVTGSVGKTGTKEMLRTALGAQGRAHAADKSFNNHWGVPLTLARMPAEADYAVIEIGMNAPGEIAPLARLARPHVAMITTVAAVHLAAFDGLAGIAREKAAIFAGLEPGGTAVLNRDVAQYPILLAAARRAGARLARFGSTGRPEYRLLDAQVGREGTSVAARRGGETFFFKLAAPGAHLALNALGALACVEALGADLARAALALASWRAPEGRGARWTVLLGPGGLDGAIRLIDESYNANPAAMAAALEVFAAEKPEDGLGRVAQGRRIAFLGDMLELGPSERALHEGLAEVPAMRAVTKVHCAGGRMRALYEALPPGQRGEWFETAGQMAERVGRLLDAGDIAMVKGSLGSRVGQVVEAIKRLGDARPPDSLD
ncbi:UDP-N-acetylmuramoyl-tripeptide--D-alanyl-D-alanine ligase [Amaricoccus solimangrovi]|uniref:UDP-N-acetylmuramoyl-tripeptide--D-alanyl-D-alanine ligase n=1 Tax=Amaricoccus solimangrovi TaxID=2589815 RepID=A0A501WMI1_9RHOB|nr:UDP-N-acetylmuramoyl-tripeptide--D-alanyl-D-alanine ligase [Amaricoccus solimangrovi]TPE50518.1 UDP-N-acetylmuramoyl-tripeptide--D-alanyl-D-alanine ligase [Amaricoccus solimangrovi]